MKKVHVSAAQWAVSSVLCTAFAAASPITAWAQATPPRAAAGVEARIGRTYLSVRALRDAGGLPTEGRDKKLNEQFAAGLRKYLKDVAKDRFEVDAGGDTVEAARPARNARVLTVEGDLSRTEDGKGGGPYLAVLRLYQEKSGTTPRRLMAQWAGVADNYRYLTGNLDSRADVDREGLLGEMGKRVAASVSTARGNATFDAFIDQAEQTKRVLTTLVPDEGDESGSKEGNKPSIAAPVLRSGQGYRVRVASKDGGAVYVVRDEGDRLLPLFVPGSTDELQYVDPGKPLLLPGSRSDAWIAPRTNDTLQQTLIVLVRRDEAGAKRPGGIPAPTGASEKPAGGTNGLARPGFQLAGFKPTDSAGSGVVETTAAPVRVLSTGTGDPVDSGPLIAHLTKMLTDDPDGTWTAQRLVVRVVPSGGNNPRPRGSGTAPANVTTPAPNFTVPAPAAAPKEKR